MEKYNKPFMSIKEACTFTGLSQAYLRKGVKDGSIPSLKSGVKYLINVPLLLEKLNHASAAGGGDHGI